MDRGIRVNVNHKFVELLPTRAEVGNTVFRANVIAYAMSEFGITLASAATHYNHAFKTVRAAQPELVADLGRAEDKKGGRKPKAKTVQADPVVELQQTEFTVKRKSDGTVVAEGLSFEAATALVAKAKSAKKSSLYWV